MPTAVDDLEDEATTTNNKAEKKEKREPRESAYVVFATTDDDHTDPLDATWQGIGEYIVVGNGGQKDARRQALNDPANKELRDNVLEGGTIHFFCVPKQSFQPQAVRLDAPSEPKIIV